VVGDLLRDTADIVQAGTVMSAWERLKQEDFDLMIIDMGLPDGSGLELLPALRRSTQTPIPSLVFSAHGNFAEDRPLRLGGAAEIPDLER